MLTAELLDAWIAAMESGEYRHYIGKYWHGNGPIKYINDRCAIGVLSRLTEDDVHNTVGDMELNLPSFVRSNVIPINDESKSYEPVIAWLKENRKYIVEE